MKVPEKSRIPQIQVTRVERREPRGWGVSADCFLTHQPDTLEKQRDKLALALNMSLLEELSKMSANRRPADAKFSATILQTLALHQQIGNTSFRGRESVKLTKLGRISFHRKFGVQD